MSLTFDKLLLAIHVGGVLIAFGVLLVYPLLVWIVHSVMAPLGLPLLHRAQLRIIQRLVNPGLTVVAVSGVVLALDLGTLGTFYSKWGIAAAIVLGAITGGYLAPREARLAQIAERDVRDGGGGGGPGEHHASTASIVLSRDYQALSSQVSNVTRLASLIVLATIVVMIAHK